MLLCLEFFFFVFVFVEESEMVNFGSNLIKLHFESLCIMVAVPFLQTFKLMKFTCAKICIFTLLVKLCVRIQEYISATQVVSSCGDSRSSDNTKHF